MVLTDRQRAELHAGMHEYLLSRPGEGFAATAAALARADPSSIEQNNNNSNNRLPTMGSAIPLLEKKWTAVPRLQKKVLELERSAAQAARIHAHRSNISGGYTGPRRMLPRPPCSHTLAGHSNKVTCVIVHPIFTVVCSGSDDATIKIWDHESGEYVRTLKGHTGTVHSLSFTPMGCHLASSSSDLSIKLWDFSTYTCIRTLRGHDHTISALCFIPSGVVPAKDNGIMAEGEKTSSSSTGIDATLAGTAHLISASRDQTVKFWDVETGFCVHTSSEHSDWVRCVAVRYDGEFMATSGNDSVVIVYRAKGDRKKLIELRGHEHVVETLSFVCKNPSGDVVSQGDKKTSEEKKAAEVDKYLASGGRDRVVRLWDIFSGECLSVFKYHENWVRSVIVHPGGNYIISAGDDRSIRVFDIKSNRCLRTIDNAHGHFVTTISMHHTLPILVSGSVDNTVKCWMLD